MMQATYHIAFLKKELSDRCEKNPRYSLRAFAQALGLDPGTVSKVLNGKKVPSYKLALRISKRLGLSPEEQERFLASLAQAHRERGLRRISPFLKNFKELSLPARELSIELSTAISEWYHAAILELTFVRGFKPEPKWIASQLRISVAEAKLAVDRLLELELLEATSKLGFKKATEQLTTADKHITNAALRRRQAQMLEKARQSLENDPIEVRNMTSMTMAIDPKKLPIAKKMMSEFNQAICSFLESGERTQVYELGIALFPIQKGST